MVLPSLEMGGAERMVVALVRQLAQRGWSVGVICTRGEGELATGLRASGIPVAVERVGGLFSWIGPRELVRRFREGHPDVVHTHSGFWLRGTLAARRAAISASIHTVHGLHTPEPWWGPTEKKFAGRLTDAVACVSPPLVEYLAARCQVPRVKLHLIPNGIDVGRFGAAEAGGLRGPLGLANDALLLGTVARLAPVKNIGLIFEPLGRLVAAGHDAHFVIAGDGPARLELTVAAAAAAVADRVHFLGMVDDPSRILPEFDIFVITSHAEGTSLSLLEAMASGRPCVATAVGGNPEVLAHGMAGRLVPPDDERALAEELLQLAADPAERARLGRAARARAVERYSLAAMVDAYEALYRSLLSREA